MTDRSVTMAEFGRVAKSYATRTAGRFDHMDVVAFARAEPGESVMEVGAGTGNFLRLFAPVASRLVAVDITPEMVVEARRRFPEMEVVVADGAALPFPTGSFDLVSCAQMLHHVHEPVPIVTEMRWVAGPGGRVLVVDQIATESYEECLAMDELERLRDPSHAASRPPSALRVILTSVGLEIVAEKITEQRERLAEWMPAEEFPSRRIEAVTGFVRRHRHRTGMGFVEEEGDFSFTRRRMMLLAQRAR